MNFDIFWSKKIENMTFISVSIPWIYFFFLCHPQNLSLFLSLSSSKVDVTSLLSQTKKRAREKEREMKEKWRKRKRAWYTGMISNHTLCPCLRMDEREIKREERKKGKNGSELLSRGMDKNRWEREGEGESREKVLSVCVFLFTPVHSISPLSLSHSLSPKTRSFLST